MKQNTPHHPSNVPITIIGELRAERSLIEELLDATPRIADQPDSLRIRRNTLCDQIEQLEQRGDGGPMITVTLDAYGSALVRRLMSSEPAATEADVANTALGFMLGESDDHGLDEELAKTIHRRTDVAKEAR